MVISFLKQHPSETVLMRLKLNEHSPEGNTRSANATMKLYYDKYEEFFWKYNNNNNPRLGEIRRRIIIIQDFKSDLKFGLMFTKFILQDNYKPHSVQAKKHSILNYFIKGRNGTKKIINHLSASKNPFYSSKDISKFTNPYMIQLINEKYDGTDTISTKYIGIIPADFPSDMLIRSIILVNAATF
jgi:1-phosphatidylinositol phosphodiesterase